MCFKYIFHHMGPNEKHNKAEERAQPLRRVVRLQRPNWAMFGLSWDLLDVFSWDVQEQCPMWWVDCDGFAFDIFTVWWMLCVCVSCVETWRWAFYCWPCFLLCVMVGLAALGFVECFCPKLRWQLGSLRFSRRDRARVETCAALWALIFHLEPLLVMPFEFFSDFCVGAL